MNGLMCIINSCDADADGIVMVNHNDMEITMFMIPACTAHAEVLKNNAFNIQLNINENPRVEVLPGVLATLPADLTLSFVSFENVIG